MDLDEVEDEDSRDRDGQEREEVREHLIGSSPCEAEDAESEEAGGGGDDPGPAREQDEHQADGSREDRRAPDPEQCDEDRSECGDRPDRGHPEGPWCSGAGEQCCGDRRDCVGQCEHGRELPVWGVFGRTQQ